MLRLLSRLAVDHHNCDELVSSGIMGVQLKAHKKKSFRVPVIATWFGVVTKFGKQSDHASEALVQKLDYCKQIVKTVNLYSNKKYYKGVKHDELIVNGTMSIANFCAVPSNEKKLKKHKAVKCVVGLLKNLGKVPEIAVQCYRALKNLAVMSEHMRKYMVDQGVTDAVKNSHKHAKKHGDEAQEAMDECLHALCTAVPPKKLDMVGGPGLDMGKITKVPIDVSNFLT